MTVPQRRDLSSCLRVSPGNGSESEEEHSAVTAGSPALTGTHWAPDSKFHPGHTKMDAIKRGNAKDSQRHKVHAEAQSTVTQNFSSETRQDTEYVSAPPPGGGGAWEPEAPAARTPSRGTPRPGTGAAASLPTPRTGTRRPCPRGVSGAGSNTGARPGLCVEKGSQHRLFLCPWPLGVGWPRCRAPSRTHGRGGRCPHGRRDG